MALTQISFRCGADWNARGCSSRAARPKGCCRSRYRPPTVLPRERADASEQREVAISVEVEFSGASTSHSRTARQSIAARAHQRTLIAMIALPAGVRVYLAAGATDLRKGFV